MFDIQEELKKLPVTPGVYIMQDEKGGVLYVGKAVNLRNRVRSYFRVSTKKTPKIQRMVSLIDHFDYILTDTELEALVLENNLIKEHKLDFKRYEDLIDDLTAYEYLQDIVHQYKDIDGKFAFMVESGSHNDDYGIAYIRRNMAELIKKIQVRRGYSTGYGY